MAVMIPPTTLRDDFPALLRSYRERTGHSQNQLALRAGIDSTHWSRLELGQRSKPGRPVVEAMARALRLSPIDGNRLLVGAGYAPPVLEDLGGWNATLQRVTDVLADVTLSEMERAEFAAVVQSIAARWQARR